MFDKPLGKWYIPAYMNFLSEIEAVKSNALKELDEVTSAEQLQIYQTKYLGRKGIIRELTSRLSSVPPEEKAAAGRLINELKNILTTRVQEKEGKLGAPVAAVQTEIDLTLPGTSPYGIGHHHPIYTTLEEANQIFSRLGFEIAYGPEIETEYHNFTALNIPLDHPSRDAFDTFYLAGFGSDDPRGHPVGEKGRWLLRSHTSPVQIRVMKTRQPPFQVIMPGKVFRPDTPSASRFPMFHQVEGLVIGESISFGHLKGILDIFCKEFFGPETKMRFRPSFFPFTEPSAEVDITCVICKGEGYQGINEICPVCRGEGWLEILGAGMVHPQVLENINYDSERYTGYAFGMGVERIAMLKYGINDIRLFTENHIAFLTQF